MKKYWKTKKEWEKVGILKLTPEDQKDKVAHALNVAIKWLFDTGNVGEYINIVVPVVIAIIVNKIDVSDEKICEICEQVATSHEIFAPGMLPYSIDAEGEFLRTFCDAKTNELEAEIDNKKIGVY